MKVTKNWLVKHDACSDGMMFVTEHKLIGSDECHFIRQLVKLDEHEWALWLLVRRLKIKDRIRFVVYCAKGVLPIYETKHPNDDRPRKAIEAAEACIADNTKKNRVAAMAAARAAKASGAAVYAAWAAVYAARAAAYAPAWEAMAAEAAECAADSARTAQSVRAKGNDQSAMLRYIEYGVELLEGK